MKNFLYWSGFAFSRWLKNKTVVGQAREPFPRRRGRRRGGQARGVN